jgi:hypothetical protein
VLATGDFHDNVRRHAAKLLLCSTHEDGRRAQVSDQASRRADTTSSEPTSKHCPWRCCSSKISDSNSVWFKSTWSRAEHQRSYVDRRTRKHAFRWFDLFVQGHTCHTHTRPSRRRRTQEDTSCQHGIPAGSVCRTLTHRATCRGLAKGAGGFRQSGCDCST